MTQEYLVLATYINWTITNNSIFGQDVKIMEKWNGEGHILQLGYIALTHGDDDDDYWLQILSYFPLSVRTSMERRDISHFANIWK